MDLQSGGTIVLGGNTIEVEPCKERIHGALWGNGALIEVLFHAEPLEGEDVSDRIQLLITPAGGKRRGWLMNVEDALEVVEGLHTGIKLAVENNVPLKPVED